MMITISIAVLLIVVGVFLSIGLVIGALIAVHDYEESLIKTFKL
jgi:uncharacterized protein YneF (UPF0154 family)